jgi:4-methylaminobutanoate oxidase (formaldehyde-forming)
MGPKAQALLEALSSDKFGKDALPFSHVATVDVGYARVRAARMSYVGGPGYELYVPVEQAPDALRRAVRRRPASSGLKDAGYYTIDALRIEAGRRAWGAELSPDETPWEAGPRATRSSSDKAAPFLGREALVAKRDAASASAS